MAELAESTHPTITPVDEAVAVLSNEELAPSIWLIELSAPLIAGKVRAGQFVHVRIPHFAGHVLRRPFSVYRAGGEQGVISILYQVVGAGSERLTQAVPGDVTRAIGPMGRGWSPPAGAQRALLVGGGMGAAPLAMLAEQLVSAGVAVDFLVGALCEQRLVGIERLVAAGAAVQVCTDDGSAGHHGFCTDLIEEFAAAADYAAVCGPEPMERAAVERMRALRPDCFDGHLADRLGGHRGERPDGGLGERPDGGALRFEVSLERRMACGVGACLSCVVDTTQGKKRVCVDGPVFEAKEVIWR